jgi:hypothetical protein
MAAEADLEVDQRGAVDCDSEGELEESNSEYSEEEGEDSTYEE